MSTFEVPVVRITAVEHHPNADRLSLVSFRGFTTISAKREDDSHRYAVGDLAVYVPEAAIVPEYLLRQGFWDEPKGRGILAGPKGDRVKAIRLRGIVSQGLMFPTEPPLFDGDPLADCYVAGRDGTHLAIREGEDASAFLGITKYEPVIPIEMAGEVFNLGAHNTLNFDIENIQKHPDTFRSDEQVVVTEKLHGTFCQIAYLPNERQYDGFLDGAVFVGSKGLSAQGLMLKNNERNAGNLYKRAVIDSGVAFRFAAFVDRVCQRDRAYLVGEVFGRGVQDLGYGLETPSFRVFGVFFGAPRDGSGHWLDDADLQILLDAAEIDRVPVLARGRWEDIKPKLAHFRDGGTTLGGDHIREGVVITPAVERQDEQIGRAILKAVSPDYLLRKGQTTELA